MAWQGAVVALHVGCMSGEDALFHAYLWPSSVVMYASGGVELALDNDAVTPVPFFVLHALYCTMLCRILRAACPNTVLHAS